jgi:hypothetical protein
VVAWVAIGCASVVGLVNVSLDVLDPLEWATVPIAGALLVTGGIRLARSAHGGSWQWLAPGVLVLLLPSLAATFSEQPVWRLVGLGAACVALVVIGALGRLQAPLVLGSAVVLVHATRTFAPQLVAVYQLTEWWVWAVIGGALIIFVAVTFERRMRNVRAVGGRIAALR